MPSRSVASLISTLPPDAFACLWRPCGVKWDAVSKQSWCIEAKTAFLTMQVLPAIMTRYPFEARCHSGFHWLLSRLLSDTTDFVPRDRRSDRPVHPTRARGCRRTLSELGTSRDGGASRCRPALLSALSSHGRAVVIPPSARPRQSSVLSVWVCMALQTFMQRFKLEFITAVCLHYLRRCSRMIVANEAAVKKTRSTLTRSWCNRRPAAASGAGRDVTESQRAGPGADDRRIGLPLALARDPSSSVRKPGPGLTGAGTGLPPGRRAAVPPARGRRTKPSSKQPERHMSGICTPGRDRPSRRFRLRQCGRPVRDAGPGLRLLIRKGMLLRGAAGWPSKLKPPPRPARDAGPA